MTAKKTRKRTPTAPKAPDPVESQVGEPAVAPPPKITVSDEDYDYRRKNPLEVDKKHYDPAYAHRWFVTHNPDFTERHDRKEEARESGWEPVRGHRSHKELRLYRLPKAEYERRQEAKQREVDETTQRVDEAAGFSAAHAQMTDGRAVPGRRFQISRDRPAGRGPGNPVQMAGSGKRYFDMGG